MIIVGEQESDKKEISLRSHGGKDYGKMKVKDFVKIIKDKIKITENSFAFLLSIYYQYAMIFRLLLFYFLLLKTLCLVQVHQTKLKEF